MPPTDQININSLALAAVSAVLALVVALWMRASGVKNKRIDDLETAVEDLRLNAAVTDTKVTPLWAKIQKQMNEELHHPHAEDRETDLLIDKLENLEASPSETARLKVLFHARATDPDPKITARERSIAKIMPVIMDLVLEEAACDEELTEMETVAVPVLVKKEKPEAD